MLGEREGTEMCRLEIQVLESIECLFIFLFLVII